jgi:hypothetical protein
MDDELEYFQYLYSNPALAESTDLYHEVLSCLESEASSAVADIQESLEDTDRIISCIEESDQQLCIVEQYIQLTLKKIKKKRVETKPLEENIRTTKITLPNTLKLIQATKKKLKMK